MSDLVEKLTAASEHRFIKPIKYHDIWDFYKRAGAAFWTMEEINFGDDASDWRTELNDDERHYITTVLAFFASSDVIVNANLAERAIAEVTVPELIMWYGSQIQMENIHTEVYTRQIEVFFPDEKDQIRVYNSVNSVPCLQEKKAWCYKYINDVHNTIATRTVAFAIVEGIFFSSSFASIFWLRERKPGKLKGLTFSNEKIMADEGMHRDLAVLLYNKYITNKMSDNEIHDMVRSAVDVESTFVKEALKVNLIGMHRDQMIEYVQYVADHLLASMGHSKLYRTNNPFPFMERISMAGETNFFEKRVGEYSRASALDGPLTTDVDY